MVSLALLAVVAIDVAVAVFTDVNFAHPVSPVF
jgi:hypothetical protein